MELYHCNRLIAEIFGIFSDDSLLGLKLALGIGAGVWAILFILQGIGLYRMAKNRVMKHRALAFVPFVNLWYMGKLAGECNVFGRKMKRAGLYAMLSQIALTIIMGLYLAAELYLFMKGEPHIHEETSTPYWDFSGFAGKVETFYEYGGLFMTLFELVYAILMVVLLNGLFKQYAPQKYMVLSIVFIFLPQSRFISIFCLRNRQPIDYAAYMRAKREAYMRQRQQYYNQYSGGYHNANGNPYGGYRGNPYGNPYGQPAKKPEEPFGEFGGKVKDDEPFGEFSGGAKGKDPNDPDGFFD